METITNQAPALSDKNPHSIKGDDAENRKYWDFEASRLNGYTIEDARYMDNDTRRQYGWEHRALTLTLTKPNAPTLYATLSRDDEGNGPGSLFLSRSTVEPDICPGGGIMPVLYR